MSNQFPDPLHERDRREAAEDRAERRPVTLADLSPLERSALELLRRDEPRILHLFAFNENYDFLLPYARETEASLMRLGLAERSALGGLFVRLTPDGARLQAELFAEGGAE